MVFIILFGVVAITFIVFNMQMAAYKEAAHKYTNERKNKLVEYLGYQYQYWGMLFGNPKIFPCTIKG
jgi:glucose uptake protein GlcU